MTTINLPTYSASIGNLTVQSNLIQPSRLYLQHNCSTGIATYPTGTAIVQFPTAVVEENSSKITISNSNSRFQNASTSTLYLAVTAIANVGNLDSVPQRISLRIAINGAVQANGVNIMYYPASGSGPLSASTLLRLAPNDFLEVSVIYPSAAGGQLFSGALTLCQV